ncbi:MAG: hypothetical protein PHO57_09055 [Acidithiobacillus sp.]|nr:hypothetical protein [Acidithiobacillus sp.]
MHLYTKALAFALGKTIQSTYQDCAELFLTERPWMRGLRWRPAITLADRALATGIKSVDGWTRVSVRVRQETTVRLEALADQENISLSDLYYTMLYWWVWYQYPPAYERERRSKLQQESKS